MAGSAREGKAVTSAAHSPPSSVLRKHKLSFFEGDGSSAASADAVLQRG